jgi:Domain of unknown function (DUF5664)
LVQKKESPNPKDLVGITKVSLSKLPVIATAWGAMAMQDGAAKYGPFNWRDNDITASVYIDAAKRHLDCWFEGQENASDSHVHHLGHALACCAILLDAQAVGRLIDDRPVGDNCDPNWYERFLNKLSGIIKEKQMAKEKEMKKEVKKPKGGKMDKPMPFMKKK